MVAANFKMATTVYEREIVGTVPEDVLSCFRVLKKMQEQI